MDHTLQALADPVRRAIVEHLMTGEQPVGALARRLPIAQSGVSRHLRILKAAGLVRVRPDGQRRLYSLQAAPFNELSEWLMQARRLWEDRLNTFETALARRRADHPTSEER